MKSIKSILFLTLLSVVSLQLFGQETYFPASNKISQLIDTKYLKSGELVLLEKVRVCGLTNIKVLSPDKIEDNILYTGKLLFHNFNELPNNNWILVLVTDITDDVPIPLQFHTITFIDGEISIFTISDDQTDISLSKIDHSAVINSNELVLAAGTSVHFTDFTLSDIDTKTISQPLTIFKSPFPDNSFLYYRYGEANEIYNTSNNFISESLIAFNLGSQFRDIHYFDDWAVFHDETEVSAVFGFFFFQLEKDKEILGWRQHGQNLTYHTISEDSILNFKKIFLNDGGSIEVDSTSIDLNTLPKINGLHWDGNFLGYDFEQIPLPAEMYTDYYRGINYNLNYNTNTKELITQELDISIDEIQYTTSLDTQSITEDILEFYADISMEITISNLTNEPIEDVHLHSSAFEGINCAYNGLKVDDDVIQLEPGGSKTITARYETLIFNNIDYLRYPLCLYAIGANQKFDENFEDNIYCLELSEFTSIDDIKKHSRPEIYPNPVSNHIYIKNAEQNTSYSIYNYEGRLMKKIKTRDVNMKIDISDLTPGIYLIYNKKTRQSETFVKQ